MDITDPILFPEASKKWKSFISELVVQGRAEVDHHEEVDPVTMEEIFNLLANVKIALEARGNDDYEEKLMRIPAKYHQQLNYILQWGAQFVLTLWEVRRGGENLENLKKKDFSVIEDNIFDFKYVRKTQSEKEKNQQEGSNSTCHGVIPFINLTDLFNPKNTLLITSHFCLRTGFCLPNQEEIARSSTSMTLLRITCTSQTGRLEKIRCIKCCPSCAVSLTGPDRQTTPSAPLR